LKRTIVGHEPMIIYPAISISFLRMDSNPAAQVMTKFIFFVEIKLLVSLIISLLISISKKLDFLSKKHINTNHESK